jgi:starch-binding outer membrane protein, SusD/RagB family
MKTIRISYLPGKINRWTLACILLSIFAMSSCKKFVDVDPPVTNPSSESVFNEDATAISAVTSIYTRISQLGLSTNSSLLSISKKTGLSADELTLWSGGDVYDVAFFTNALNASNVGGSGVNTGHEYWTTLYSYLYTCNAAIEGLTVSQSLTPAVKQQLLGEAKFMRAFIFFYLVNLYGDVPLVTVTDYELNRLLPRSNSGKVYQLIISDLKEAQVLLSSTYLNGQLKEYVGSQERVRPTSWAATALLARSYLYINDFPNAEIETSKIISNTSLFSLSTLPNVFLKTSKEAIWQLQPVNKSADLFWNTEDARMYVVSAAPVGFNSSHPVYLSQFLLSTFEANDGRRTNWIGSYTSGTNTYYFPNKYKVATAGTAVSEYQNVFRLAEQFLIRAEARANQNNISGAQNDLNIIRTRAGLGSTSANDVTSLLNAIQHERQVELFTEWGHRWLDLKRTGKVDEVMNVATPAKANGVLWKSFQQWYPLPMDDVLQSPNLVQNNGY